MVFLKWYLIVCAAMMLISYLRIWGAIIDFRKQHPNAIFKRVCFVTAVFNFIKFIIYFIIPVFNLIAFIGIFITSDEKIEDMIISKCEQI